MDENTRIRVCFNLIIIVGYIYVLSLIFRVNEVLGYYSPNGHVDKRPGGTGRTPGGVNRNSNNSYKVSEGCYGYKQLRDMLRVNHSQIKYKPQTPEWCSKRELMVPQYLKNVQPQVTNPPYHIRVYQFNKSDAFRVVLKSTNPEFDIVDTIMVARDVDLKGVIQTNSGRFLRSEGVELVCCSFTDKDAARFKSEGTGAKQVVFYWVPYEEIADDYEGDIIFIATMVASSSEKYWMNITSGIVDFTKPN